MALFQALLWAVAAHASFWPDADHDGYGDPLGVQNDVQAQGYVSNDDDCDDTQGLVHPGAVEQCNNSDEDCDDSIDEPDPAAAAVPGGVPYYRDEDEDGWGAAGSGEMYVCPIWIAAHADSDGTIEVNGRWTTQDGDCRDVSPVVHPAGPDTDLTVYVDGFQPICGRGLALVELDCDNDGALPALPTDVIEHASDVGLASCVGRPQAPTLNCFGISLVTFCDVDTGLWMVPTDILSEIGVFSQAWRVGQYTLGLGESDCDDLCPVRHSGYDEMCDGIDNDCSGVEVAVDANQDGIPDAMETNVVPVPGTVPASETRVANNGYQQLYECDGLDGPQVDAEPRGECISLEVIPAPAEDTGDDEVDDTRACGCSSVGAPGGVALVALAGLIRRRRR